MWGAQEGCDQGQHQPNDWVLVHEGHLSHLLPPLDCRAVRTCVHINHLLIGHTCNCECSTLQVTCTSQDRGPLLVSAVMLICPALASGSLLEHQCNRSCLFLTVGSNASSRASSRSASRRPSLTRSDSESSLTQLRGGRRRGAPR